MVNVPDVEVLFDPKSSCGVVVDQSAASCDGRSGERQVGKVGDCSRAGRSGRDIRQSAATSNIRAGVADFVGCAVRSGGRIESCSCRVQSELEGIAARREIVDALQQLDLEGCTHRVAGKGHITIS